MANVNDEWTIYPTAIVIKDGNGNVIYTWSKRKVFLPNPPGLTKRARLFNFPSKVKVRQVGDHLETTR